MGQASCYFSPRRCTLSLQQTGNVIKDDDTASSRYVRQTCAVQQQYLIDAVSQTLNLALPLSFFPRIKSFENFGLERRKFEWRYHGTPFAEQ